MSQDNTSPEGPNIFRGGYSQGADVAGVLNDFTLSKLAGNNDSSYEPSGYYSSFLFKDQANE